MALTLAVLRPALIDKLGLLENDEMIPVSSLNRAINAGAKRMSSEYPWPWLKDISTISLTAGINSYTLPSGAIKILTLSIGDNVIESSSLEDMVTYFNISGEASSYALLGNQITFGPTPAKNETANIVYSRLENTLVDDDDVLITPEHYDDVILTYAALWQAIRMKDQSLVANMEMMRKQWLTTINRDQITTKNPRITLTKEDW
jgi:hypothetical protein